MIAESYNSRGRNLSKSSAHLKRRKFKSSLFAGLCFAVTALAFVLLVWLLWGIWRDGAGSLSWNFLTSFPSRRAAAAGIKSALFGTLWVVGFTTLFAVPIGIGAAIYLQEYAENNRFARFAQVNIANLAGVPSIVYGILGLALFVRVLHLERSVLAAGLTLALLILPVIIISAQEALRAVPSSLREGSYALGATRWQTIRRQVLPVAMPGILTGIILSVSRAMGETAPLIMMGALTYVAFVPSGPLDSFTVLPIQIFNWTSRPQEEFQHIAAAGSIVLLAVLLSLNAVAIWLRHHFYKKL
ncbi:MAG TPA: phosphate ABC transporter permease PstA [Abditibacteriaceae bacterium]|nr:phosphate ABC transporter permease PstA [Abditibacteriaceae bacterium]